MQPWAQASLVAAVLIGGHYLLVRAASGRLGDTLAALVLEGSAALGLLVAYALLPKGDTPTSRHGVLFAALSGLCISGASILMFVALRRGGPVAATGTIMLGGGVTLSALLAPFIFGEGFTLRRSLGIALGLAAMALLSTDR
jgi:drug/metabolite transporter (DMT)-like permease